MTNTPNIFEALEERRLLSTAPSLPVVSITAPVSVAHERGLISAELLVTRSGDLSNPLPLDILFVGSAVKGVDYQIGAPLVIPAGQSSLTLPVDPLRAGISGQQEVLNAVLVPHDYALGPNSQAIVTVMEDTPRTHVSVFSDSPIAYEDGQIPGDITVMRKHHPNQPLMVNLTTAGAPSYAFEPLPTQVYFAPGVREIQIPVTPIDVEITGITEVSAELYPGNYRPGTSTSGTVTIKENDSVVTIAAPGSESYEDSSLIGYFQVSRTGQTSQGLTVYLAVGGSGTAGVDYLPLHTQVYFASGQGELTVYLYPIDQGYTAGGQSVTLSVQPGPGYSIGNMGTAEVDIVYNDSPPDIGGDGGGDGGSGYYGGGYYSGGYGGGGIDISGDGGGDDGGGSYGGGSGNYGGTGGDTNGDGGYYGADVVKFVSPKPAVAKPAATATKAASRVQMISSSRK